MMGSITYLVFIVAIIPNCKGEIYFKKTPHVKLTENTILSGKLGYSREGRPYQSFTGINFATFPERFAEATLSEPNWNGVKEAVEAGRTCAQGPFGSGPGTTESVPLIGQEDCLNLNIYVPMNNTGKKGYPVMVFIHGGGFMFGGGHSFGPQMYMDEDVVLVTVNHRLGVFGFLSTEDEIVPGNNGMKDIVLGLKWIQNHIGKFGGDPGKVTIFGSSAGAAAVHYLMLSPTAQGLFHRAISQSGSAHETFAYHPNPRQYAVQVATYLNCPSAEVEITSEEILTCLKNVTTEELNKAQFMFRSSWPNNLPAFYFGPVREPVASGSPFLTKSPYEIIKDKSHPIAEVPYMTGIAEHEGDYTFAKVVLSYQNLLDELNKNWNELAPKAFAYDRLALKEDYQTIAEKLQQFYFGSKTVSKETEDELTNLFSDEFINYGVYKTALETAARGKKNRVYFYQYSYIADVSMAEIFFNVPAATGKKRAGHGDDAMLQFVMGDANTKPDTFIKQDSKDEEFSKNLIKLFVSFARHGEPKHTWGNSPGNKWKAITRDEVDGTVPLKIFKLDENPSYVEDIYKERMTFWDQLHKDYFEKILLSYGTPKNTKTEL